MLNIRRPDNSFTILTVSRLTVITLPMSLPGNQNRVFPSNCPDTANQVVEINCGSPVPSAQL